MKSTSIFSFLTGHIPFSNLAVGSETDFVTDYRLQVVYPVANPNTCLHRLILSTSIRIGLNEKASNNGRWVHRNPES